MKLTKLSLMAAVIFAFTACVQTVVAQNYKVDADFAGKNLTGITYLAVMSDNNICGLKSDGAILVFNSKGKVLKEYKVNLPKASVLAVDKADNMYVLGAIAAAEDVPAHAKCVVLDKKGGVKKEFQIMDITHPSGAKIVGDDLLVADPRKRMIGTFNASTGEKKSAIEGMRACCGILDFAVTPEKKIVVAHLGAFKVDFFDGNGQAAGGSFGERGRELTQFHGCCNPVNVGYLSNGNILSVEKDPTRIKIFNGASEAAVIDGITELVSGCSYIPLAIDEKDNIYLASRTSGIVKCVK